MPEQHDPDSYVREFGAEAFRTETTRATPLTGFLLDHLAAETDLKSAEGRAQFAHLAQPLVTRVGAPMLRLQLVKSVAQRCGLAEADLMSYNFV